MMKVYRVRCDGCGFDADFYVRASLGDAEAVAEGRRLHGSANESQERRCPTYLYLRVELVDRPTISADEFDRRFDAGEDITPYLDLSSARRPGRED